MNILAINIILMTYLTGVSSAGQTTPTVPTETPSSNGSDTTSIPNVYTSTINLYREVLENYDTRVLPRKNTSQPIDISASFILQGVFELDTVSQKLSILGYYMLSWRDEILVWNASTHGGIDKIKLPISQVWVPPLRFSQTHGGKGIIGDNDDIVEITSDGRSALTTDNTYNIFCDVDIRFYPFDKHDCVFYVFVTQMNYLDVNITTFNTQLGSVHYKENTEWRVVRFRSTRLVFLMSYVTIRINLELERRHEFILFTTICPLVLLSVINVGVFLVPVNTGEKGSISVTIFLSYSVFITAISEELPCNSLNISYILIYILLLLLLSILAVVYAYIQSYIYDRYANERVTFSCLRKLLNVPISLKSTKISAIASQSEINQATDQNKATLMTDGSSPKNNHLTWHILLQRLDVIIFIFMLLIVVIATPIFFAYLSSGLSN